MSDLDEIAAAAGIAIVDDHPGDGGDAGRSTGHIEKSLKSDPVSLESIDAFVLPEVLEYEAMFGNRYTDLDPEYVKTIEDSSTSNPPCVTDFYVRRQREDNRSWHRNRYDGGERRDYRGRNDGWNRGYNKSYGRPGDYGDYNRDEKNYRQRSYRDRSPHR